jgi:hypothetical protein
VGLCPANPCGGGLAYLRQVHEQEGECNGSRHGKPAQDPQAFMSNVSLINHQPPPLRILLCALVQRLTRKPPFEQGGIPRIVEHDIKYAALARQQDAFEVREYAVVV